MGIVDVKKAADRILTKTTSHMLKLCRVDGEQDVIAFQCLGRLHTLCATV